MARYGKKTQETVKETMEKFKEHHIQEEERKIFKSAEKALDDDEIQNIMKRFEQEKQKIKKNHMKSAA